MKNNLPLPFLLISFVFCLTISQVSAHVLVTDQNIGAILHINPDDDPIANVQSTFFFEFKDRQDKFKPQNCNCTFSIIEKGTAIYVQPLFQNNQNPSLKNASVFYTFPQKDVYQIQVTGKPLTPNTFQPFTLTYNIRVDQTAQSSTQNVSLKQNSNIRYLIPIAGIMLILLALTIKNKYGKKSLHDKHSPKKPLDNQYYHI